MSKCYLVVIHLTEMTLARLNEFEDIAGLCDSQI